MRGGIGAAQGLRQQRRVRPAWAPRPPTDARLPALVLKLLKMATGMRALLDTVVQALPQVGQRLLPPAHIRFAAPKWA